MKKTLYLLATAILVSCGPKQAAKNQDQKIIDTTTVSNNDTTQQKQEKKKDASIYTYPPTTQVPSWFDLSAFGENYKPRKCKDSTQLMTIATALIVAIKDRDMGTIEKYVHPKKGVRFSPYMSVNMERDVKMSAKDFTKNWNLDKKFLWSTDWEDEIRLTMKDYFSQKVYDRDYIKESTPLINVIIDGGNTYSSVEEDYPTADYVEYYIAATEKGGGLDWNSLGLVFEMYEGTYKLVGIVHACWTP